MMQFAFSTTACPEWSLEQIATKVKELGYDGIELDAERSEKFIDATGDQSAARDLFQQTGLQICCFATGLAYVDAPKQDRLTADRLRKSIDGAREIGCKRVTIAGARVKPGSTRSSAGVALGEWLLPLGDYAAGRGVMLLVENTLSFRLANEMWFILDRLSHPAIKCCWNTLSAAIAGESPAVSVPMLNSKIAYVRLDDANIAQGHVVSTPVGAGNIPLKLFFTRMRGIGFQGWMTYAPTTPDSAMHGPDDRLIGAIKYLREFAAQKPKSSVKPIAKRPPVASAVKGTAVSGV